MSFNKSSVCLLSLSGVGSVISGRADEREKFITSNNRGRSYRSGLNMKNVDVGEGWMGPLKPLFYGAKKKI